MYVLFVHEVVFRFLNPIYFNRLVETCQSAEAASAPTEH